MKRGVFVHTDPFQGFPYDRVRWHGNLTPYVPIEGVEPTSSGALFVQRKRNNGKQFTFTGYLIPCLHPATVSPQEYVLMGDVWQ